ncbi:transglycosylase domain-containing protein [Dactylosporangium sp. NPDC049140]|uniref:transglycosylase domain-containing protein n=1 Tax=Dactylosporangium sp. NPDC049140 TaxID=3155647 RepID=UPI003408C2E2
MDKDANSTGGPISGRARIPGALSTPGADHDRPGYRPAGPPAGRASVGRAGAPVTGSASIPSGRATVGSASVPSGRASVGGPPAFGGRATVGSASVSVISSSGGVPEPGDGQSKSSIGKRAKRRRRRNITIASIAAFIMIAGIGMVAGTYYFDQVALPEDISLAQSTTIYYSDGQTRMGSIGENRTVLAFKDIPVDMQHAVVAAEDNTFYTNDGVDYKGVVRAAWNNVSGGDRQGASTISQQYARRWADLEGVTYARKVREAVIALKLNQQYSKDEIMTMYLNIVYFGRGAYGVEAAAQAYFAKPAKDLKTNEAMLLAGLVKNPEGSGNGSPFDPNIDKAQAQDRFNYIKGQMVQLDFVKAAEADTRMKFPDNVITPAQARDRAVQAQNLTRPEGLIVHHVLGEVSQLKDPRTGQLLYEDTDSDGKKNFDKIRNGGLKIVTTIDKDIQQIAVREASRNKESNMDKQPPNLQAALVAVEPGNGGVKAYYGGDSGNGCDYASYYVDPVLGTGQESCGGGHPPGSTFKVYTLATALMAGYSIDSMWDGVPRDFPGRTAAKKNQVKNATEGVEPECHSGSGHWCTLEEITVQSLNVPFYAITLKLTPARVIDTARAAGIRDMWATVQGQNQPQRMDLTKLKGADVAPKYFQEEVGFGQYPITVLDHAGGLATIAARGTAFKTHFLKEVWTGATKTYGEILKGTRIPGFTEQMADDMAKVLTGVPVHYGLKSPYTLAGKTGTWQLGNTTSNAHAWMGGFAPYDPGKKATGLAAAVWVGNAKDEQPIKDSKGNNIIGGKLPGPIWNDFMSAALAKMNMPKLKFPKAPMTGDKEGDGISPTPAIPGDPNFPGFPGGPGQNPTQANPGPTRRR